MRKNDIKYDKIAKWVVKRFFSLKMDIYAML